MKNRAEAHPVVYPDDYGSDYNVLSNIYRGSQNDEFLRMKSRVEAHPFVFPDDDGSDYNVLFSMTELQEALRCCSNTAAGEDEVYYAMFRHIPCETLSFLLTLYNRIWTQEIFPSMWHQVTVLPFLKPGKDPYNDHSYRHITHSNCLCKMMERMVNHRMVFYLEKERFFYQSQYGFPKGRCSLDAVAIIETYIKMAFARKEYVVAVFLI